MRFYSKLLQRRAAAEKAPTLEKIYDVYMTPEGRFAAGEQEEGRVRHFSRLSRSGLRWRLYFRSPAPDFFTLWRLKDMTAARMILPR